MTASEGIAGVMADGNDWTGVIDRVCGLEGPAGVGGRGKGFQIDDHAIARDHCGGVRNTKAIGGSSVADDFLPLWSVWHFPNLHGHPLPCNAAMTLFSFVHPIRF